MTVTIRFDNQVAIVTGAGNGLGRSHALELARRGARVVVNDLGGARDGSGSSSEAADAVVKQIIDEGGEAFANGANVADYAQVEAMVKETVDRWGRVDILVNNAGILRDKTFAKMELKDFQLVMDVHVMGSVNCTKAVWELMREQKYGRIIMTTSSSGLYGNFGQANYGAAKMAVVGFMNTLCLEGQKYGIKVNSLAPVAATRMTEDLMPEQALKLLQPESVTPAVIFMASKDAPNRQIIAAGAGAFAKVVVQETVGVYLLPDKQNADELAAKWEQATALEGARELLAGGEQTMKFLTEAGKALGIKLG
jgi:NAD(P)-dependent dehydrogenase (short-subunit alcohol dehydrogenase family)